MYMSILPILALLPYNCFFVLLPTAAGNVCEDNSVWRKKITSMKFAD